MNDFAGRRYNCRIVVFSNNIFDICFFVFPTAIGFHKHDVARYEHFVCSFFVMKLQNSFLIRLDIILDFIEIDIIGIEKDLIWLELCYRMDRVIVLCACMKNFVNCFGRILFSKHIGDF